ncbi:MAG: hypothetical protein M3Z32_09175 [Acidobacteriota bacterium]|nr:hypothetical protein [Acidobacteriota bacterium]
MARNDYTLIVYDENGDEQRDQHGDLGSAKAVNRMQQEASTDVFLMSHGWQGDVPGALDQYNHWTDALLANPDDLARFAAMRPGFKPLIVGLHWPSLPWGNESAIGSFGIGVTASAFDPVADYAKRLGDTPAIHAAVQRVFSEIAATTDSKSMPPELEQAYLDLDKAVGLGAAGVGGPPGDDRAPFNPKAIFTAARNASSHTANFGSFGLGSLKEPLRVLSFWKMKDRARVIGEGAGFNLLRTLQQAGAGKVRFHVMGHSFGCIVVSAMLAGPRPAAVSNGPVQSLVLVEGALSLWAYAPKIPPAPGATGYFNPVVSAKRVNGPIVAVRSTFDRAVGFFYPLAAGVAHQVSFDVQLPLFGGVGTYGLQGVEHTDLATMLPTSAQYGFQPGQIYNIESSNIIKDVSDKISGAHSDIRHPEVGHVLWQAAMTAA